SPPCVLPKGRTLSPSCEAGRLARRHRPALLCTYMMAAPPGTETATTGNGFPCRVTVRPAMMPTLEPNTASLSQWRFAGSREIATYDEKMYAGTAPFQPR